jgi:hypothetical protein
VRFKAAGLQQYYTETFTGIDDCTVTHKNLNKKVQFNSPTTNETIIAHYFISSINTEFDDYYRLELTGGFKVGTIESVSVTFDSNIPRYNLTVNGEYYHGVLPLSTNGKDSVYIGIHDNSAKTIVRIRRQQDIFEVLPN